MSTLGIWITLISLLPAATQEQTQQACTVAERPLFALLDPAGDLLAATGVMSFARDRIAVAGASPGSVSVFNTATGRLVGRAGRLGSGPGEFRNAELVGVSGDSMVVWDRTLRRISMVTPAATVARGLPFELDQESAALAYDIQPVGMLHPRRLLLIGRQGVGLDAESGIRRDSVSYLWSDLGERRASLIARFAGAESATLRLDAGMLSVMDRPLGVPLLATVLRQGLVVNSDGAAALRYLTVPGAVSATRSIATTRRPVTSSAFVRASEQVLDQAGDMPVEIIAELRKAMTRISAPQLMPAIDRLLTDGQQVWVREAHPEARGATRQRWMRFNATGEATAVLELPLPWRVQGFGTTTVVVLIEQASGEGTIQGWPFRC